jgi:molybdopterin synthase catalytic subunit
VGEDESVIGEQRAGSLDGVHTLRTARVTTDIRDAALSVDEVIALVTAPEAGGIDVFVGVVRDHDHGRAVTSLEYSAHPSALDVLQKVGEDVAARHPDVVALAAIHRIGPLAVGDLAVVVGASAPHRAEAFAACRAFIDTLKDQVPIWKREEFADGEHEWVGC